MASNTCRRHSDAKTGTGYDVENARLEVVRMKFLYRLIEDNDGDFDEYAVLSEALTALLVNLLTQWLHVPWGVALAGALLFLSFLLFLRWRWKVWS